MIPKGKKNSVGSPFSREKNSIRMEELCTILLFEVKKNVISILPDFGYGN